MEASLNILVDKLLTTAAKRKASNIHLTVGSYPALRIDEELVELEDEQLVTEGLIRKLAESWLDTSQKKKLQENKSLLFTTAIGKKFRVRIHFFFQRSQLSVTLRIIPGKIPPLETLGLPKSVNGLVEKTSGLIVVAGPYGSGRTTTIASMIEAINKNQKRNIVTIEHPIEYLFLSNKSIVEQREVGIDTNSFVDALETASDSDADVIVVGSSEDQEAVPLTLEFASSGRLALLHMNTVTVQQTVQELLASFRPEERQRGQLLLAEGLRAIIVQRLVPKVGGGQALAVEVLLATDPVKGLIREGRVQQINTVIQSSRADGMITFDQSLTELVKSGDVLLENAEEYVTDPKTFRTMVRS